MKRITIIFLLILNLSVQGQQRIQIIYKVSDGSVFFNEKDLKEAPEGIIFSSTAALEVLPRLTFKLTVLGDKAHFSEIKSAELPIKNYPESMVKMLYKLGKSFASGGEYYLFIDTKTTFNYFDGGDGVSYLLTNKLDKYKWKLSNETKTISGYTCYMATTQKITNNMAGTFSKPVTAWYAPAIPISFGPKDYNGLPGLILELQEGTIGLYATQIDLNPKENFKIEKPTKGKLMTQEAYDKTNGNSYEKAKNLLGGD